MKDPDDMDDIEEEEIIDEKEKARRRRREKVIDDDEEEEKEDEKEDEEGEDADATAKFGSLGIAGVFKDLILDEDEKIKKEERELLKFKRKRQKLKKMPLLINQKKNRKREPTLFQKIFNTIAKSEVIDESSVRGAASKFKYELEKEAVNYFIELGNARSSLKKFGLPSNICKNPFHIFTYARFPDTTNVLTDDKIVWDAIYASAYNDKEYVPFQTIMTGSRIVTVSVVTNEVFECKSVYSGYIQDFYKDNAVINSVPIDAESATNLKTIFERNGEGSYTKRFKFTNGKVYNYYQYKDVILCGEQEITLEMLLKIGADIKCVNSKNKLAAGLKEVKIQDKVGTYINIHDVKVTDFSPSCLFTDPIIKGVDFFINGELDTNSVYNSISQQAVKTKNIVALQIPPDVVFWDNISSFMQILGLIAMVANNINETIKNEIIFMIETYNKHKDVLNSWKKVYKRFESIVLGFYDAVTTKLTIDGVTKLDNKVNQFIADYLYLRNDFSYSEIRRFLGNIPKTRMIANFTSTSAAYEIASSISKLITILKAGKKKKGEKINEIFRTIGVMCTRVLFGGDFQIIPKVRSKAAFLGGPGKGMSNETIKKNIDYLLDKFKADFKKGAEEVKLPPLKYEQIDAIMNAMISNSARRLGDKSIQDNIEELKKQIKADDKLRPSLVEDIQEMYENEGNYEDLITYADFLDNPYFNSFVGAFSKINEAANGIVTKVDPTKLVAAISIDPGVKIEKKKKKKLVKNLRAEAPKELELKRVVQINAGKFNDAIAGGEFKVENGQNKLQEKLRESDDLIAKYV